MGNVQRSLDRAAATLRRKRIKVQKRLQEKLQEELLATDLARLEAGSGSGPANKVTFAHRMADRWAGFSDAVVGRHHLYDVVAAYKAALKDKAEQAKLRVQSAKGLRRMAELGMDQDDDPTDADAMLKRADGTKITEQARVHARIAELESNIAMIEAAAREDATTAISAYEKFLTSEEKENSALRDRWYQHLQRPAYFDRISSAVREDAEAAATSTREASNAQDLATRETRRSSIWERMTGLLRNIVSVITQNAVNIAIPIEAYFTFPAFLVLTPKSVGAATAGCLMFTGALAGAGAVAGLCYRRSYRHTLAAHAGADRIETRRSLTWSLFSIIAAAAAAVLVVGGADLRAKVPTMSDWLTKDAYLNGRFYAMLDRIGTSDPDGQRAKTDKAEYDNDLKAHNDRREGTLQFGSTTRIHADEVVAWGVYLFLVILSAIKVLVSTDPYYEYELLSAAVRNARESRLRLSAARDGLANARRDLLNRYKQDLNTTRTKLWLLAPDDALALGPSSKAVATATASTAKATPPVDEGSEAPQASFGDIWCRERLRLYVRSYTLIRGKSLKKDYPSSLKEAMS